MIYMRSGASVLGRSAEGGCPKSRDLDVPTQLHDGGVSVSAKMRLPLTDGNMCTYHRMALWPECIEKEAPYG
jgi:hypothetical protein